MNQHWSREFQNYSIISNKALHGSIRQATSFSLKTIYCAFNDDKKLKNIIKVPHLVTDRLIICVQKQLFFILRSFTQFVPVFTRLLYSVFKPQATENGYVDVLGHKNRPVVTRINLKLIVALRLPFNISELHKSSSGKKC